MKPSRKLAVVLGAALIIAGAAYLWRAYERSPREVPPPSRTGRETGVTIPSSGGGTASPMAAAQTHEDFEALLARGLSDLPTRAMLRDLTEEQAHEAPPALDQAAEILGDIAERLKAHPEWAPKAAQFYEECARRESLLIAVRALCLANADALPSRYPEARLAAPDHRGLPDDLERLARQVK